MRMGTALRTEIFALVRAKTPVTFNGAAVALGARPKLMSSVLPSLFAKEAQVHWPLGTAVNTLLVAPARTVTALPALEPPETPTNMPALTSVGPV